MSCQFSPLSPPLSHSLAVFRTVISAFVCLITCLLCQTQWAIWQPWWWPSVLLGWGSFPITYLAFSSRDSWLKGVRCFGFLGFLPLTRWVSHLGPGFEVEASRGSCAFLEVSFFIPRALTFTWLCPLTCSIDPSTLGDLLYSWEFSQSRWTRMDIILATGRDEQSTLYLMRKVNSLNRIKVITR